MRKIDQGIAELEKERRRLDEERRLLTDELRQLFNSSTEVHVQLDRDRDRRHGKPISMLALMHALTRRLGSRFGR